VIRCDDELAAVATWAAEIGDLLHLERQYPSDAQVEDISADQIACHAADISADMIVMGVEAVLAVQRART
jgi:hypothetical protein